MSQLRKIDRAALLLDYLFATFPEAKRKLVRTWLKAGAVEVNGRSITRFDHALKPGDLLVILPKRQAAPQSDAGRGLRVRLEDEAVLVVEKPAGLLSIATPGEQHQTAYALLTEHVRRGAPQSRERVWIVHRLDRETSGLMVFARTEAAKRSLQENWDEAEKKYLAVVEGAPSSASGWLESHLDETDDFKVRSVKESSRTRLARTHYRTVKRGASSTLLELTLETGRRHQIRVQMAEMGCPIIGDGRYGAKKSALRRIALHATKLSFRHPTTGEMTRFVSPLPGDLGTLL